MPADGSKFEADVVLLAIGYGNILTTAQRISGAEVAGRCKGVPDLGDEGEIGTVNWFLSSILRLLVDAERYGMNHCLLIEGLSEVGTEWSFMGWNFAVSWIYSRMLALQIKAVKKGSNKQ